jgi:hypothetical protein
MNLDWSDNIRQRISAANSRYAAIRQVLTEAHRRLREVIAHQEYRPIQLVVSELDGDQFESNFAGISVLARLEPQITQAGVPISVLSFYEQVQHAPLLPPVASIKITPHGQTDCKDPDGDELGLVDCLPEALLTCFEQLLRKRGQ